MVIKDPQLRKEIEAWSAFERVLGALVMGSLSGVVFYGIYWLLTYFLEIPNNLAISISFVIIIGGVYGECRMALRHLLYDAQLEVDRANNKLNRLIGRFIEG